MHPIISLDYAKENYTPSQLRTLANSLERIAKKGYGNEPCYDYRRCISAARDFRGLASSILRGRS